MYVQCIRDIVVVHEIVYIMLETFERFSCTCQESDEELIYVKLTVFVLCVT